MNVRFLLLTGFLTFLFSSCVPHRELKTFDEAALPLGVKEAITYPLEMRIQANDLLRIDVQSPDPNAALPFNQSLGNNGLGQLNTESIQLFQGYLVDQNGMIELPIVGSITAKGLTLEELQDLIRSKLGTYFRESAVSVSARYLNYKVTILGEVLTPGIVPVYTPRLTILEALGLVGDMTPYANRRNILLIREQEGARTYARIDLHKEDIFSSPYYYLQQNDVLYVEPLRARTATVADRGQRVVSYGTAILSLAALVITLSQR